MRDPRTDPQPGDVIYESIGPKEARVREVTEDHVLYHIWRGAEWLAVARVSREQWLREAAWALLEPWNGEEAEPCD